MKTLYENEYITIKRDEQENILIALTRFDAVKIDENRIKKELSNFMYYVEKYDAKLVLLDTSTTDQPLTKELEAWIAKNLTEKFEEMKVKKVAHVLSHEYITRLGIEMYLEEVMDKASPTKRMIFESFDEAIAWLKK